MRTLTASELRVLSVLLASRADPERVRLHQLGVPRSTYHAIRRRAYESGWLKDRYIPHPGGLGRPVVTVLLVRPYADRRERFKERVSADPGNVLLWLAGEAALAVFFHRERTELQRIIRNVGATETSAPPVVVTAPAHEVPIPVYFDYEGLWSGLAGMGGTLAYPRGFAPSDGPDGADGPPLASYSSVAVSSLLRRPFEVPDGSARKGASYLSDPRALPFPQQKLLRRGWVTHRTLLNVWQLPAMLASPALWLVLMTGTTKRRGPAEEMLARLNEECGVHPFLFVAAPDRWILGALGSSSGVDDETFSARRPTLSLLLEYLEGIEIVRERLSGITAPVDQRYDRLVPRASSSRVESRPVSTALDNASNGFARPAAAG